jgi:hypothetical protein
MKSKKQRQNSTNIQSRALDLLDELQKVMTKLNNIEFQAVLNVVRELNTLRTLADSD